VAAKVGSGRIWLTRFNCRIPKKLDITISEILSTSGRRAFPVAGPTVWNSLPDELKWSGV